MTFTDKDRASQMQDSVRYCSYHLSTCYGKNLIVLQSDRNTNCINFNQFS